MRTFYFRQGISGLLMATMVAFISMLCVGFLTSCGGDDDDELAAATQLLIALKSGSSDIDGMVYIFPNGDYDPTTFMTSTLGSIETKGGQKVTGIGSGAYYKGGGYCKYDCQPGTYYVVGVYMGTSGWGGMPHQTWKGQKVTAVKNKPTVVEIKLSTSGRGCQN